MTAAPSAQNEGELHFYRDLSPFEGFVGVTASENYVAAPDSWLVVISDVIGSTKAIEAGRYKDVNAVGVACIVAVQNAVPELEFPYVFGGDGATLLIPEAVGKRAWAALSSVAARSEEVFDLRLRLGAVPVSELRKDGFDVRVARFRASPHASFGMFSGPGLIEAERRVKDPELGPRYLLPQSVPNCDLSGLECRWRPIPSQQGRVVSVLIQGISGNDATDAETYRRVLKELDGLLSGLEHSGPIVPSALTLGFGGGVYDQEARLISGRRKGFAYWRHRLKLFWQVLLGVLLLKTRRELGGFDGAVYKQHVMQNSDFRKFDGTLRLVLDLSEAEYRALRELLERERERGVLVYGTHSAPSSLMTCIISSYDGDHVHFIDGANGGYALAAKELKAQLRGEEPSG